MQKNFKTYWKLFASTFNLSAFTLGGGYVIVPLMKKKFVDELKWIDENEMLDMTAIAQSSPGAIAVNASILLGYRVAGISGALVTVLGTVLPPLIILTVISFFYAWFKQNTVINMLLKGMQAGVAAVIADVVLSMGGNIIKDKKAISIIVMVGAFIAAYLLNFNIILIIFVCGIIGAIPVYLNNRKKEGELRE